VVVRLHYLQGCSRYLLNLAILLLVDLLESVKIVSVEVIKLLIVFRLLLLSLLLQSYVRGNFMTTVYNVLLIYQ